MPKVSHYNSIYFLSYAHLKYMICLFTNISKQQNMLKSSLLIKKKTNFTGKYLENSQDQECKVFRLLFLYEPEHIVRFSNLHQCTFSMDNPGYHSSVRSSSAVSYSSVKNQATFLEVISSEPRFILDGVGRMSFLIY